MQTELEKYLDSPNKLDKESIYLLQTCDSNCNDCFFMQRDMERFNESIKRHEQWQLSYFNSIKNKLIKKANEHKKDAESKYTKRIERANKWCRVLSKQRLYKQAAKSRGADLKLFDSLMKEANKMKFTFEKKEAMINYGKCIKFNKDVSFIPNTCQLETQSCFQHRKSIN